jgi:hypothetical protein
MGYVKKWKRWMVPLLAAVSVVSGGVLRAQNSSLGLTPGPGRGMGPFFDAIGVEGFAAGPKDKVVAGAPYSASFSTQSTQTLPDGNQITRTSTGTFARDSQGRTRRDLTLESIGPWAAEGKPAPHVAFINDVVAGTQYILQPDQKTARKMVRSVRGPRGSENPRPSRPVDENVVSTSLGTQTINGVSAEGTRYTRTIPAGMIGNAKPIITMSERWYSSELQATVMSKRSDPRTGETVFQLTNVQRGEPDSSLFQVPPDFTIKQGPPHDAVVIQKP